MPNNKQYLDDSVYADYDGYHIILTTENGMLSDPSNIILLDPNVIALLNKYVEKLIVNKPDEDD